MPYSSLQEAVEDRVAADTIEPQRSETRSVASLVDVVDDNGVRSTEEIAVGRVATDRILPRSDGDHEEGPMAEVVNEALQVVSTLSYKAHEPAADRPL